MTKIPKLAVAFFALIMILLLAVVCLSNKIEKSEQVRFGETKTQNNTVKKSFSYNGTLLTIEENPEYGGDKDYPRLTMYITKEGKKYELIHDVPFQFLGEDSAPEIKSTAVPSIVYIESSFGDVGMWIKTKSYVNVDTGKTVKFEVNSNPELIINDGHKISLAIDDKCGRETRKLGTALLKDLTLNDLEVNVLSSPKTLKCLAPDGVGEIYDPVPNFELSGITQDFSKAYFKLYGVKPDTGGSDRQWNYDLMYDLQNVELEEEKSTVPLL
jgi:hypothetical protein